MPWLLSEDAALKAKLQGLMVYEGNTPGGREIPVRFRLPQVEISNLSYPIFIIEHAGQYPAHEREHRGYIQLPYAPEGQQPWYSGPANAEVANSPYYSWFPFPWDLHYQITLYARFMETQAQPLVAMLATEQYLHPKFAFLNVPQDGTVRSMFLLGGPEWGYGTDGDGKRLIRVTYLVNVYSELATNVQVLSTYGGTLVPVSTVDIDLGVYSSTANIDLTTPASIEANRGIINAGVTSSFNAFTSPT